MKSRITVLQLISSAGVYGAETMLVGLAQELDRRGVSVVVGAFEDSRDPHTEVLQFAARQGLQTCSIPCAGRFDRNSVRKIRSILVTRGIDVVHSHGYKSNLYTSFASMFLPVARVCTCHNWPAGHRIMKHYAKLDRLFIRRFDWVCTPSPVVQELVLNSGVPVGRVAFIPNGVDLHRFSAAEPTLRKEIGAGTHPLIGLVGRLVPGKGGAVLLQAARTIVAEFPEAKFVFVGEGPSRTALQALAAELEIDRSVLFTGSRNDMPGVLASLDIVTLPSLEEAMPMCLLEAMAARRPVVATSVGAVPEVIRPNVTGLLTVPGDSKGLADAILRLLRDALLARSLAAAGQEHAARNYSNQAMGSNYLRLYASALADRFPNRTEELLAG
jgi:glycosyltransferase involved in cell wall biosynthesis